MDPQDEERRKITGVQFDLQKKDKIDAEGGRRPQEEDKVCSY